MDNPYQTPSASSQLPPPIPGQMQDAYYQPHSSWPKVLGILAMVFGGFAFLGALFGLLATGFAMDTMKEMMAATPEFGAFMDQNAWLIGKLFPALQAVLAVLCFVGGLLLFKRSKIGQKMLLFWAVGKIAFVLATLPTTLEMAKLQITAQKAMMEQAAAKDPAAAKVTAVLGNVMEGAATGGAIIGVVWSCAFPLFLLLWFGRGKIRRETATWEAAGGHLQQSKPPAW